MDKIKIIRAPTKDALLKKMKALSGEISRMSYSNIGGHRATIIFK